MKIVYPRISTREQSESLEGQEKPLIDSGCDRVFRDVASGANTSRPGLAKALD